MKLAALSALLLAGSAMAIPARGKSREAYDRRMARRAERRHQFQSRPMETSGDSSEATVKYLVNWAGAVETVSSGVTQVSAVATCPTASMPSGGSSGTAYGGAAWVGIDGGSCKSAILQTGIKWVAEGTDVVYSAWYEWFPAPMSRFGNFTLSPGDPIAMSVTATSLTSGTATLTNQNTGQTVTQSFSGQPSLCGADAEWIVEDYGKDGTKVPFASFTPVTFTSASWTVNGAATGVSGATDLYIRQNDVVLAEGSTSGSSVVNVQYTG